MREVQYTWSLENHKRLYGVQEDAPESPDEAEPDRDTNLLAKIEQKPQPVEKKSAPTKASQPADDAHTGEHTEPARTWGSKKNF